MVSSVAMSALQTYLGELVDSENEARAFGILGVVFSFGLFLGPVLGGGLARPASWEPQIFAGTLFERHPFLLANLIFACLVIAVFLLGFAALKETRGHEQASGLLNDEARDFRRRQVLLPQGRRLWQLLIASCLLCGYIAARLNSLILVSSLPTTLHGLGISSHEFACVQACAAFMLALNQTTCYGCLVRKVGNHAGYALGLLWTIAITLPMPFTTWLPTTVRLRRYVCFPSQGGRRRASLDLGLPSHSVPRHPRPRRVCPSYESVL